VPKAFSADPASLLPEDLCAGRFIYGFYMMIWDKLFQLVCNIESLHMYFGIDAVGLSLLLLTTTILQVQPVTSSPTADLLL